jgi:hypothetical protein
MNGSASPSRSWRIMIGLLVMTGREQVLSEGSDAEAQQEHED